LVSTPGDHVLHAKWQNNEYTLKFDYNYEYRVNPDN